MRTAVDPQSSGLYERRCCRDYPGILTTEGKLGVVGNIQNITQFKVRLLEAQIPYLTVYDDDDDNNNNNVLL
jgi:hypothetical protein